VGQEVLLIIPLLYDWKMLFPAAIVIETGYKAKALRRPVGFPVPDVL